MNALRVAKPVLKVGQLVEMIGLILPKAHNSQNNSIFHFSFFIYKVGQLVEMKGLILPMAHNSQKVFPC
ncbi:MAG: hypothetical protein DRR08_16755 [Candidatus Parabeggiatoa sp. nov. 2]|nr:MAG: hypothetical protein B6247_10085 [Beggiatoa sp. 4572_84]RKZ58328.1 MAG: hypothetical protein DRR08_16755 [Gammaproteobacteria bacterium]